MSLNLAFENSKGEWIDFPIQTPTQLTKAVLVEPDESKRLKLIQEYLEDCDWVEEDIIEVLSKIKSALRSGHSMIIV